jgi:hypothetical protein
MSIEKIRPRVIDATGDFTFNNVTATGNLLTLNANLGNIATANYIKTDNLQYANGVAWPIGGAVTASGSNTQVQFNNAGSLGSSANFVFDKSTNRLTVDNITANGAALTNITGANVSGTVGNANFAAYAGNITVAAQGNITSLGTLSSLSVTGNISSGNANLGNLVIANYYSGSGNNLSNIQGANVTGAVSYATTANAVAGANVSGAVTYAGTANAVSGGNVMGAVGLATYATTANAVALANVSGAGNVASLNKDGSASNVLYGNGVFAPISVAAGSQIINGTSNVSVASSGNVTVGISGTSNTVTFTSTGINVAGYVNATGNLTSGNANLGNAVRANYFIGDGSLLTGVDTLAVGQADIANSIANGTSNVNTPIANGNITVSIGGVANTVVFTSTGMNVTGNITTAGSGGNLSGANYVIANYFSGSGNNLSNIQGANVTGAVSYATTANSVAGGNVSGAVGLATYATTANAVAGANVSGAVAYATTANSVAGANVSGTVSSATTAGTVTTAAQGNITSVGTLTSLSVSGDISGANLTLSGNLIVSGTTTTVNSTTTRVVDPVIELGGGANGATLTSNDSKDRGTLLHYYTTAPVDAFMGWDSSNSEFAFGSNVTVSSEVTTFNTFGNVRAGFFLGNGSGLSGISAVTAVSLVNGNSNVVVTPNSNVTISVTSTANVVTVTTTGVNIAGYANLGSGNLLTTGNASAGFFIGNGNALYNIQGANVTGNVGNALNAYSVAVANVSGIGNIATINKDGNSSNVLYGNGVFAATAVTYNNSSVSTYLASFGSNTISTTGNANVGNLNATTQLVSSVATGTAPLNVTSTTRVANLNVAYANVSDYSVVTTQTTGTFYPVFVSGNTTANYAHASNANLSFNAATGNLTVGNIVATNIGNISSINKDGNSSNVLYGNGVFASVGSISVASLANGTSNVNIAASGGNITMGVGGTAGVVTVTSTGVNVAGYLNLGTGNLTTTGNILATKVGNASTILVGDGANITGIAASTAVSLVNGNSNVVVTPNSNVTISVTSTANVVTVTSTGVNVAGKITSTGNIDVGSNYFVGNGFYLTGLDAAGQIANGTSNIRIPTANANITFTVNGTTAANLTSSGFVLLGTGNITAGNVFANAGTIGASALTGTLSTANQYNVTNVGTLGNLAVTTNITSGNVYANSGIVKGQYLYGDGSNLTGLGGAGYIFNGTSNVFIATANGNVSFTVGGYTNILTVTTTGANIGGYANVTGNLAVVGNITSGNANLGNAVVANYFIGNFYGNANTAGTVITASQPNITSVGTLTSLTVSGITNLGSVSNVRITGGSAGQYLATDGAGNLSWGTPSGGGGGGTSLTYTAATTPPGTANIADQWFNTTANVLYEYINDGSASYWVDISSPSITTAAGSSGSSLTIKDEGSNLTTAAASINFVGGGVTATNTGNAVTVTVPTVTIPDILSPFLLMGA